MQIAYGSDLHLEFGDFNGKLPEADVLVLAGDLFVAKHTSAAAVASSGGPRPATVTSCT